MIVKSMDDLILDLLILRTPSLLIQNSEATESFKRLIAIAEAWLVERWSFDNLHMNRIEAISRHLEHAVERRLRFLRVGIRETFQYVGEDPEMSRAVGDDARVEMSEIHRRIDAIVSNDKDRFSYGTSERINALVNGDDRFIEESEREECSSHAAST